MIVCNEIRKVRGGYIVVVRAPYHDDGGLSPGERICKDFAEVVEVLRQAANEPANPPG